MAGEEEERAVEQLLEFQLNEHKSSLTDVEDALSSDPFNSDLLSVHVELVEAIRDAEEGLFQLKRARVLREADSVLQDSLLHHDVKMEPFAQTYVETEPPADGSYSVGEKCRFPHSDGRWYDGVIVGLEGSDCVKISFVTPTAERMLMCKFFLQQRCRFGSSCRYSHGIQVPLSSLKKFKPTTLEHLVVGSRIWAVSDSEAGIWREAELKSWNAKLRMGDVVFLTDGSSTQLGTESIRLHKYAQMSDEEESGTSFEQSYSSDSELEEVQGLGFFDNTNLQKGVQTETVIFAEWENHTRGIASKMMANMGYREGMGLGTSGQGMLNPISARVLPPKQSLDRALKSIQNKELDETHAKKRRRGGRRQRDKKLAAAMKAAEEEEESKDVFSLINTQLAKHGQMLNDEPAKKQERKADLETKKVDRLALIAFDDEIKNLKLQAEKLEEMADRNRKEKVVYEAAMRKLNETRKALAACEAAHASASNAVTRKEKEKKWLKF